MKERRGAARRWLLIIVAVVLVAGVAFVFLRRSSAPQGARTAVERVTAGEFTRDVSGTGVVEAAQERTLTFGMSGTVAEIPVQEGARVAAGTVLARLDTAALERDLASNQASLASAQADARRLAAQQRVDELDTASGVDTARSSLENAREALREAQTSLSTAQRLFDAGATSQSDLTAAQDAAAQAQRAVSQAEAALQTAESRNASFAQLSDAQTSSSEATIAGLETTIANLQENLGEATLTAPFAGVVSSVGFDVGDQVSAAGGAAVTLVDTSSLSVKADFDENRALELAAGQSASIVPDADTNRSFEAVVRRVSPVANRDGSAAQVEAELDFTGGAQGAVDAGLIKPGYTVTARVTVNDIENTLLVPLEAVSEEDNTNWVYKVTQSAPGEGVAERVTLDVLDRNATLAAAQSDDLNAGDLIAVINLDTLEDGGPVQYDPLTDDAGATADGTSGGNVEATQ